MDHAARDFHWFCTKSTVTDRVHFFINKDTEYGEIWMYHIWDIRVYFVCQQIPNCMKAKSQKNRWSFFRSFSNMKEDIFSHTVIILLVRKDHFRRTKIVLCLCLALYKSYYERIGKNFVLIGPWYEITHHMTKILLILQTWLVGTNYVFSIFTATYGEFSYWLWCSSKVKNEKIRIKNI